MVRTEQHRQPGTTASLARAAAVVALLLAVVGCSPSAEMEDPDLTLYGAKAIAQEGERDIVALIPAAAIISVDQRPTGSLLSCTGERNYQWAGGTTVHATAEADLDRIVDAIAQVYSATKLWIVQRRTESAGYPKYLINLPDSSGYVVSGWSDPNVINVFSFSPCFHLPEGMSPHGGF